MATQDQIQKCDELEMGYQHTLMYGRYIRSLGEYAREKAAELRELDKKRRQEEKARKKEMKTYRGKWTSRFFRLTSFIWRNTFAKIGEDWVFLALLGIIMAVISYIMDFGSSLCNTAHLWMYQDLAEHPALKYFAWITLPVFLVLFSSGFVYLVAPQAIGSGIPEMKTILRGVVLKEYLTFRTLVAKVVGLTATLGSGMPLGKEGPLVHIASIVATLMSKLVTSFQGIYENESRNSEMLAAACAVGVSCCVGAPIGGVLFSIEVTSVYFAIRNYWRGFFSAVFGALMFKLMAYWFDTEETLTAIFRTNFQVDFPYDPHELFIYALIGAFGGLSGAFFILCHRKYVLFMRQNKRISSFLQKNRFIYPAIVSTFIATLYFPLGMGRFLAAELTNRQQIVSLFSNFTWMSDDLSVEQAQIVSHWSSDNANIFVSLGIFMITTFFLTVLASTLPVPSGSLIPVFKIGAAFGRIIGEAMHLWFPEGVRFGTTTVANILPGGYAIVGAAAFSSGVTHAISICVVVSEMTGQIHHIIPVLVAVLVSNAISTLLQPSLYDSIIMIKKLPYLPDILSSSNAAYTMVVEDFMVHKMKFIWRGMTYQELKNVIKESHKIRSFPLVDSPNHMILLGSIRRKELINLITSHIGHERRLKVAAQRAKEAALNTAVAESVPQSSRGQPVSTGTEGSQTHEPAQRKTSRFQVVRTQDVYVIESADGEVQRSQRLQEQQLMTLLPPSNPSTPVTIKPQVSDEGTPGTPQPIKSILKRTNSFTIPKAEQSDSLSVPLNAPEHPTVTGVEGSKLRHALGTFIKKSSSILESQFLLNIAGIAPVQPSPNPAKKVTLPQVIDMTPEEQKEWEENEMKKTVDWYRCSVDPAPFQLVERTSLLKVHSIFSLLGVNHAYVTSTGQLVGIVSLKELRKAIESVNSGTPSYHHHPSLSSQGELGDDARPGAPEDVETGPDMPITLPDEFDFGGSSDVTISSSVVTSHAQLPSNSNLSSATNVTENNETDPACNRIKLIITSDQATDADRSEDSLVEKSGKPVNE